MQTNACGEHPLFSDVEASVNSEPHRDSLCNAIVKNRRERVKGGLLRVWRLLSYVRNNGSNASLNPVIFCAVDQGFIPVPAPVEPGCSTKTENMLHHEPTTRSQT
ncbi:hypothetical protein C7420_102559 [Pantoea ananatis]|nr:hypothetical protein C7420_102559 [Pantoea ananatis]REF10098.1 hypothetical protein C7428_2401 [Pantoea ananatis]